MSELIREMIHFRRHLDPEDHRDLDQIDLEKVKVFKAKYDKILKTAKREYEYESLSKYNKHSSIYTISYPIIRTIICCSCMTRGFHTRIALASAFCVYNKRKQHQEMTFRIDEGWKICATPLALLRLCVCKPPTSSKLWRLYSPKLRVACGSEMQYRRLIILSLY